MSFVRTTYLEVDLEPLRNGFMKIWISWDKDVLVIPEVSKFLFH